MRSQESAFHHHAWNADMINQVEPKCVARRRGNAWPTLRYVVIWWLKGRERQFMDASAKKNLVITRPVRFETGIRLILRSRTSARWEDNMGER